MDLESRPPFAKFDSYPLKSGTLCICELETGRALLSVKGKDTISYDMRMIILILQTAWSCEDQVKCGVGHPLFRRKIGWFYYISKIKLTCVWVESVLPRMPCQQGQYQQFQSSDHLRIHVSPIVKCQTLGFIHIANELTAWPCNLVTLAIHLTSAFQLLKL